MSRVQKRTYNSAGRKALAKKTKEAILKASKSLFQAKGYDDVTIDNIAHKAGISASSIYSLFRSKQGLVAAIMDEALPEEKRLALVDEVIKDKSAEKRLRLAAKISREMYDAEKAQMDIFRGAPALSPELKKLEKQREKRRFKRQEESFLEMANYTSFAKGISVKEAQDILWAFTGRDMYRLFVIEQKWSSDTYEKWLGNLLIQTLLEK